MSIEEFFLEGQCDLRKLTVYLDELPQRERIQQTIGLSGRQQQLLWEAANGTQRLTMDDFVPAHCELLEPVVHWGRNSLPCFTLFQKVMCRTSVAGEFSGYNVYPLHPLIGDGYFVARSTRPDEADDHGVVIDYTRVPTEKAEHWPEIHHNQRRLGRFFYSGNLDFMRRVSTHVSIGRAKKARAPHDKWMPNWFVLCREDPEG